MDALNQGFSKINSQKGQLGEEIKGLEGRMAAAEQDKADKDDQIRSLKEEIDHQTDIINKLNKEKKSCQEGKQKTEEDVQSMDDKCNHLSRVKNKLEQSLDEVEGALKLTQETISDLERVKAELNQTVQRKEKECAAMGAKIEDEATLGGKYSKQIKELAARLEELDEELNIESGARAKAEKSRSMLKKDLEDLGS